MMRFDQVPRLMRTVRHLRTSQVWWRTRYLVERRLPLSLTLSPDETARPPREAVSADAFPAVPVLHHTSLSSDPAAIDALVSALDRGEFTHLNQTVALSHRDPDWLHGGDSAGRLWSITLHYHAWVYDLAQAAAAGHPRALSVLQRYLEHWWSTCRLRQIGPANLIWNSFSIATRLTWWIRAQLRLQQAQVPLPSEFLTRWRQSLSRQAGYLAHHLEWDLRANHLLRDAVGLAWAGRFLTGRTPQKWLRAATELAESQAIEQVLPDGGHFERSPMYHIHVLEDFLQLALLLKSERVATRMWHTCRRMAAYVNWVRHPDGSIPLFNDAAENAVSSPTHVLSCLRQQGLDVPWVLPRGWKHFDSSGLIAWHGDPWSVLWDVGDVGPSYQPGHAHADTLTLECSVRGQRLIVDPGTYGYDRDDRRRYDRSTAAHNTVQIDGHDSSEVWHIFRVGHRAKPLGVDVISRRNGITAWAAHTGYDWLPGSPRHSRQITLEDRGPFKVVDRVQGTGEHQLEGGWLLAPGWQVQPSTSGWKLRQSNGPVAVAVVVEASSPVQLTIEHRPWHPEYGVERDTVRLLWRATASLPAEVVTSFHLDTVSTADARLK
jgi:uncharacterized heparinase superfamily protein